MLGVQICTQYIILLLQTGTYNVNGRMPDSALDLKPWIDIAGTGADIVAIAFQEIVPLSAQNVVIGTGPLQIVFGSATSQIFSILSFLNAL